MLCIDSPSMRGRPSYLMILHVERISEMDLYYLHLLWILCLTGRPTYVILFIVYVWCLVVYYEK